MGLFDGLIKRKTEEVCERVVREKLPAMVERVVSDLLNDLWQNDPLFRFIKWGQWALLRANPSLTGEESFNMSKQAIIEHLQDERIKFGADGYCWDEQGAAEIMQVYHIDHWDVAA